MRELLKDAPLFYPSAKEWMWSYCIYLGPFTDSLGYNYDLGIYIDFDSVFEYSDATVYGDEPGEYMSGPLNNPIYITSESKKEVLRRATELNLIK
jgi:hypothetical protein